jgi:hypothetical protein
MTFLATPRYRVTPVRSLKFVLSFIGAALVGATTFVASPALALDPHIQYVECGNVGSNELYGEIYIQAGQDVTFIFSPGTCLEAHWNDWNPALSNDLALFGTLERTFAAEDVVFGNLFKILYADGVHFVQLRFLNLSADHTVSFNPNGGTGAIPPSTGSGSLTLPSNTITRDDMTFMGWATSQANADAGIVAFADAATINVSSDITLFAVWSAKSGSALASTGASNVWPSVFLAGGIILLGCGMVFPRRRARR